jgi:WhiB family redox-sensing transcriptional regulator
MKPLPAFTVTRPTDQRENDPGEDWRNDAACLTEDPELFFPNPSDLSGIEAAKAVCRRCHVIDQCAAFALTPGALQHDGIWGGLDETDRKRALLRRKKGRLR